MSKTDYYCQCRLVKANLSQLTHLPEKYAVLGNFVKLKQDDDTWDGGWEVVSVGKPISAEIAEAKARAYCDIWKPSTILTNRGNK